MTSVADHCWLLQLYRRMPDIAVKVTAGQSYSNTVQAFLVSCPPRTREDGDGGIREPGETEIYITQAKCMDITAMDVEYKIQFCKLVLNRDYFISRV